MRPLKGNDSMENMFSHMDIWTLAKYIYFYDMTHVESNSK